MWHKSTLYSIWYDWQRESEGHWARVRSVECPDSRYSGSIPNPAECGTYKRPVALWIIMVAASWNFDWRCCRWWLIYVIVVDYAVIYIVAADDDNNATTFLLLLLLMTTMVVMMMLMHLTASFGWCCHLSWRQESIISSVWSVGNNKKSDDFKPRVCC